MVGEDMRCDDDSAAYVKKSCVLCWLTKQKDFYILHLFVVLFTVLVIIKEVGYRKSCAKYL